MYHLTGFRGYLFLHKMVISILDNGHFSVIINQNYHDVSLYVQYSSQNENWSLFESDCMRIKFPMLHSVH